MKKLLASLLAFGLMLTGCSSNTGKEASTYEVALITDFGDVDDKSFNQGCWEGIKDYATENSEMTYTYYKPVSEAASDYIGAIDEAVSNGAKLVITPGFAWATAIYEAQTKYPEVKFVLVDDAPHSEDYSTYTTAENTLSIMYREHEAGFLAGYAVVKAGNTKLGFMGGMKTEAVIRYGYGFIAGAEYAAKELGTPVEVKYHYTGQFAATPEAQTLASTWYTSGTEVIFGCGGALGNSIFAAAQAEGAKSVGVDVDQSVESDTVITSAMKNVRLSVHDAVKAYYDNTFPGGENKVFGAAENYVALPEDLSKLEGFTKEDYDRIYAGLVDGSIKAYDDKAAEFAHELSSANVTVDANGLVD